MPYVDMVGHSKDWGRGRSESSVLQKGSEKAVERWPFCYGIMVLYEKNTSDVYHYGSCYHWFFLCS